MQVSVDDRRASARYNYRLDVVYQARMKHRETILGVGESVNVSSAGVLFFTDRALDQGMKVNLAIKWPATYDGVQRLKLVARGVVVRREGRLVAVDFEECQFRSRNAEGIGM